MPPKPKFTREDIIHAALELVSRRGADALTAKELGCVLGSSARPIFTVFHSMREVQEEVRAAAMRRFEESARRHAVDAPLFKQVAMQMVRFGLREPKLYQLLFMREQRDAACPDNAFGAPGDTADLCIRALRQDYGLRQEEAQALFEHMWIYIYGVGTLCATGACRLSEERLGEMLSTHFHALMPRYRQNA